MPKVRVIGSGAFAGCPKLESVSMPEAETIEGGLKAKEGAFSSCSSLVSVEMPKVQTIGAAAFAGCEKLESIAAPELKTIEDGDKTTNGAFADCSALGSVELPQAKTIGAYTFYNCGALTSISLPEAVTLGRLAFRYAVSLIFAEFPKVTYIGNNAFYNTALIRLVLGDTPPELGTNILNSGYPTDGIYVPAASEQGYKDTEKTGWSKTLKEKLKKIADLPE
jgi:hypothetical protein